MRSRFIVLAQPNVKVCLQLVERVVHLLAERHSIELVERSLVEAFADAVGLRALSLGARMIDVLDREIELVLVPFGIAAELAAAVGEHAQQLGIVLLEEWQYPVVQQVGRGDRRLAVIQLAESDLGIGVDEGLLVDPPDALEIADVERVLRATVAGMLALELTVGLLLDLRALQRHNLRLGEHQPLLGALGLQVLEPLLHGLEVVAQPHATHTGRRHRQSARKRLGEADLIIKKLARSFPDLVRSSRWRSPTTEERKHDAPAILQVGFRDCPFRDERAASGRSEPGSGRLAGAAHYLASPSYS